MKYLLSLCVAAFAAGSWAQSVDIKDISAQEAEEGSETTIQIKKGKPGTVKTENQWEVTDGNADVQGEEGATAKDARTNWKKACDDWKKEIREENKENKVISLNCGTMSCTGDAGHKTCVSKASFKIKTKVN
jgi:hypothetical protein